MRGVHRAIAGCAFGSALLSAPLAGAELREARLEYARGAGAERCPDEATLRSAVSTRLGYDPFQTAAPRTITASIALAGRSLRAEVKLLDASGAVTGSRELTSSQNDCSELLGAVALAISIAIDPQSDLRSPPPAPPAALEPPPETPASSPEAPPPEAPPPEAPPPEAPPLPEAPSPKPLAEPPPPARRARPPRPAARPAAPPPSPANAPQPPGLRAHAGLAGLVTFGAAPGVSLGLSAILGLRLGAASVGLEGRADLRTSEESASGGVVSSALLLGTLTPCYHYEPLLTCALLSVGVLRGEGSLVEEARKATTPFAAAGGRIGAELIKVSPLSVRVYVDFTATLITTSLELNGREVWRTAPVGVAVGIAGLVHFL